MKPLSGLVVLDFSQFLAGPSAALRLADMGARVIKVERPKGGDGSRGLSLRNQKVGNDSLLFHTINRNKESYAADLKDPVALAEVKKLITHADVLIENFRPGVMDKLGLGYETIQKLNPRLIYASVTGYGVTGPWVNKPGQDLLIQSMSGLTWLNGDRDQPPVPFALSVADSMAGAHLVEGILACLVRRGKTRQGGRVEISLMESLLSMQFEVLTTWLNDGHQPPRRCEKNNAHAWLGAPYGIYETADGYIALAMGSVSQLASILSCSALEEFADPSTWFSQRDKIKAIIAAHLLTMPTAFWLERLEEQRFWCAPVNNWEELYASEGFQILNMTQSLATEHGRDITLMKCPLRFNGQRNNAIFAAPQLGSDTARINAEYHIEENQ